MVGSGGTERRPAQGRAGSPLAPPTADAAVLAGLARHRAGRIGEAVAFYRQALQGDPAHPDALHLLGVASHQLGDNETAAALLEHAVALRPGKADYLNHLGGVLIQLGRVAAAADRLERAVELQPEYVEALYNLGTALQRLDRLDEARAALERALRLHPGFAEAKLRLAAVERARGVPEAAETPLAEALADLAGNSEAWFEWGLLGLALGRFRTAELAFRRAVLLVPEQLEATADLADIRWRRDEAAGAVAPGRWARIIQPQDPRLAYNLATYLLAAGQLTAGWRLYAARLHTPEVFVRRDGLPSPWRGGPATGNPLLVCAEQGVGDELLFASCLPDLIAEAGALVVECDGRLRGLFERSFPGTTVVDRRIDRSSGEARSDYGEIVARHRPGAYVMAGDLPGRYRSSVGDFPRRPYLVADPARVAAWRARLAALGDGAKLGICWRSRAATNERDMFYSRIADWGAIFALPGVHLVNLQYDECGAEIEEARRRFGVAPAEWSDLDRMNDFDGMAALMAGLDCVVTAETAVHVLAGALGVPVVGLTSHRDWPFLGTDRWPWFARGDYVVRGPDRGWPVALEEAAALVSRRLAASP